MFDFEKLHPTHAHAFVDGFLCGLMAVYAGNKIYNRILDERAIKRERAELDSEVHVITDLP